MKIKLTEIRYRVYLVAREDDHGLSYLDQDGGWHRDPADGFDFGCLAWASKTANEYARAFPDRNFGICERELRRLQN